MTLRHMQAFSPFSTNVSNSHHSRHLSLTYALLLQSQLEVFPRPKLQSGMGRVSRARRS